MLFLIVAMIVIGLGEFLVRVLAPVVGWVLAPVLLLVYWLMRKILSFLIWILKNIFYRIIPANVDHRNPLG